MKKTLLLIIITSLLFSSVFVARPAEAQTQKMVNTITKRYGIYIGIAAALGITATVCANLPGGTSPGVSSKNGDFCQAFRQTGESIGEKTKDFFEKITEYLAKYALQVIKQRMLAMLTDQIVTWIQGGGSPKFVTNWKDFMQDAGNQAIGDVIRGTIPQLCSPFSAQVGIVLKTPGILLPVKKFGPASCTLDQVVENIQGFYKDFRSGGWVAYQASWQPQNNFYGSLLLTIDAANIEASAQASAAKNEADSSNGFLSEKKCDVKTYNQDGELELTLTGQSEKQVADRKNQYNAIGGRVEVSNCQIITPGSFVGSLASKAVGSKVDAWVQADDIGPYLDTILNAAINRLTQEGTEGLLGLTTKENPSGSYPTQGDFDDIVNNYTVPPPQVLVQGGACTTEDNPQTSVNEGGQEGIYVTPPNGSGALEELVCQSIATTGATNQLSAINVARRKEMIETYKNMLDNQREIALLKQKTLTHMNSVTFFAQTVIPQIESCPANSDWHEDKWGTDLKIENIGKNYSDATDGSSKIDKAQKDLDKANAAVASLKNRLNQLQAPYDAYTAQNLGIPTSQISDYYTQLTNLVSPHVNQGPLSGTQLITNLTSAQSVSLIPGAGLGGATASTAGVNTLQGPAGYVSILHNDTITVTGPGGFQATVPAMNPIFVSATDTIFTPSDTYAQFFNDTTLTDEVVEALWVSYQNFKLENWLASESVTVGSPFFDKNINDAMNEAYIPYFDLFSRNLYNPQFGGSGGGTVSTGWTITSSPHQIIASPPQLNGGGLIGYLTTGANNVNQIVPGQGLFTNCTGQAVYNQAGY